MSELQRFLPADQELLVSLFYRIGNWMSHIDDTDTDGASEDLERQHMMNVLKKLSENKKAGALCNELAEETLRQKDSWARWGGHRPTHYRMYRKQNQFCWGKQRMKNINYTQNRWWR